MKRKGTFILSVFLIAITLSGCWDRRELNDIAISVGMGLDKRGDRIEVTTQIVNPGEVVSRQGGSSYRTPVTNYSVIEETVYEAIRRLTTVAPRKIFSAHLRVLVIGESLAREGVDKVMDGISRDREFRTDFYLIIAKGTSAKNVLEILTPTEKIPANKMFTTLETASKIWAPTVTMQLDEFMSDLANPAKDTVVTGLRIVGDPQIGETIRNDEKLSPPAMLKYSGIALFKGDKLVDWMDDDESKGYNYIMGNVRNTVGHHDCPSGGSIAVDVIRSKANIKGKIRNGKPEITVRLDVEQNVGEVQCRIDLTKEESIQTIEKEGEAALKELMGRAIRKAQRNKTDIFGFGDAIEDASPGSWTKMKKDWDRYFAELDVKLEVDVKLRRLGTTNNSIIG